MLKHRGVPEVGLVAASRKGHARTLSAGVDALKLWLQQVCPELQDWDAGRNIGLPAYHVSWSKTPLRGSVLPQEWDEAWRCFHETW
eukprot:3314855-Prymnesium_polylepis.1